MYPTLWHTCAKISKQQMSFDVLGLGSIRELMILSIAMTIAEE